MRVLVVAPGNERHGVVRHARSVADRVAALGVEVEVSRLLSVPRAGVDVVHVHFTDSLFGVDVGAAARAFAAWVARVEAPLVVTLHDVPGRDPDALRDQRRLRAYRDVVKRVDGVIVSAAHEVSPSLFPRTPGPAVIGLPIDPLPPAGPAPEWAGQTTVGVLGFVYPGKGHVEAVEAVARLGSPATVVALGAVSPGHAQLLQDLQHRAEQLGVELIVTGTLSGADLHAAARAVTVPLASYRTLGASGSTLTWISAARRPVARASDYARDVEARWPGSLLLHDEDPDGALAAALAVPASTWRDEPVPEPDTGSAHLAAYRALR